MDRDSRVLIWVCTTLGCYSVLLPAHGSSRVDHAVLEHYGSISKYKVHSAIDVAFPVKLPLGVHIKRVLISLKTTPVED